MRDILFLLRRLLRVPVAKGFTGDCWRVMGGQWAV
jgi:hypothetical protein